MPQETLGLRHHQLVATAPVTLWTWLLQMKSWDSYAVMPWQLMLSYAVLPRVIQTEGGCFWHSVCIHPVWVFPPEKSEIRVGSNHPALMAARLSINCAAIISQERRLQGFWRISGCLLVSLVYFMAVYSRKAHMEAHILVWMQHKQNTQWSEYLH